MVPIFAATTIVACGRADEPTALKELERVNAGNVDIVLLSADDALQQKDAFVIEFRNRADQRPVDVGTVRINATMPMAGMAPMIGKVTATPLAAGRYEVTTDLTMAGSWRIDVEWDGPAGKGSAVLPGRIQ
jgi:hypothetical protein